MGRRNTSRNIQALCSNDAHPGTRRPGSAQSRLGAAKSEKQKHDDGLGASTPLSSLPNMRGDKLPHGGTRSRNWQPELLSVCNRPTVFDWRETLQPEAQCKEWQLS